MSNQCQYSLKVFWSFFFFHRIGKGFEWIGNDGGKSRKCYGEKSQHFHMTNEMMISVFDMIANIMEKGENTGFQHFLLSPQSFQKRFSSGSLKVRIM